LREVFEDRIISSGVWSAHCPDLNLNMCDFYLCETLKQNIYRSNPSTNEEMKENIQREVLYAEQGTAFPESAVICCTVFRLYVYWLC
jgi:hypothetical protein